MNAYRFDIVTETDAELSDEVLGELCLELRAAYISFLKAKRIKYTTMEGDIDVCKARTETKGGKHRTYTGNYEM